ncbi:MAG: flagellar hook assembly protein FlgD [Spirochaetaceae bacterium]
MEVPSELPNELQGEALSRLKSQVESFNKSVSGSREPKEEMGKDEFLKLLLTQLQNQDPTKPMEDKEFIAQMAQFSSLEQMTNMATEFAKVEKLVSAGQASDLLGKTVEVADGDSVVSGRVKDVTFGEYPQINVDGTYYDYQSVQRIREEGAQP